MQSQPHLPEDPQQAVERMLEITRSMRVIAEAETAALQSRNGLELKTAIDQKADLLFMYDDAAREFAQRIEEFRSIDRRLIDELDGEQIVLKALEAQIRAFYDAAQGKVKFGE